MKLQLKSASLLIACVLGISAFSSRAFADSKSSSDCTSCKGYSYQASVSPANGASGKYNLSYEIKDVASGSRTSDGPPVVSLGNQDSAGWFQDGWKKHHKPVSMPEPSAIIMYLATAIILWGASRWRSARTSCD